MDTHEKLEACERKKNDGNVLFKAGKFLRACKKYEKASYKVDFDHTFTDDEKSLANGFTLLCNLNNAASLFRRSQAYIETSELDKAQADIKRALILDPNNRYVPITHT
ncbi:LOW QUALITY PROTEIN: TPR_11 domain-containing protein [Cephalotus follicularis]|uniref:TPR_11 domain-containing protein n=1 Tax=Cephalotus follicularis TaxID=3775 RepID=A0A1Q3D3H7_CEPFO|nr:LOW QUALITY PROTEIN: TPR_11 domain-containing protein [Cephalotus follicularis]